MSCWRVWRYKNLSIFFLSILIAFFLSQFEALHRFLLHLGSFGYLGAFIAGMLFVSVFTVATSIVILLILIETLSPLEISLIAGFGAVVGDFAIFRFVHDGILSEIRLLYSKIHKNRITQILYSRYFNWLLPVIGAVIIASPLPDEIGVGLMGISHIKTYKFLVLSFVLNSIGIFFVISVAFLL